MYKSNHAYKKRWESNQSIKPYFIESGKCPICDSVCDIMVLEKSKLGLFSSQISVALAETTKSNLQDNHKYLKIHTCDCRYNEHKNNMMLKKIEYKGKLFDRANLYDNCIKHNFDTYHSSLSVVEFAKMQKKMLDWINNKNSRIMTFWGHSYLGKTTFSQILMREYMSTYTQQAYFSTCKQYHDDILNGIIKPVPVEKKNTKWFYKRIRFLVLDDFMQESTDYQKQNIFDIIEYRTKTAGLKTILTTNINLSEKITDSIVSRVFSRISEAGNMNIKFDWKMI